MWDKYDNIWDVFKNKLNIKFHSEPVYEYKYLKTKVREFNGEIKTNFLNNGMPKENIRYSCIACITIDSVINFDKKNHPQVYLEECKYRIKKTQMPKFIKNELKSDSADKELMANLNKSDIILIMIQIQELSLVLILLLLMIGLLLLMIICYY